MKVVIESPAMVQATDLAKSVAPRNVPILISGETGTGKEVLAHIIHDASGRKGRFVPVNCAALPKELAESELFGATKGAYTGSHADRIGLIEQAQDGTLFLDELSELPGAMQAKLLRVLQDKRIRPVGATTERPVDFRLVVAMNVNPHEMIERRKLRSDLFYRINVIEIHLAPLRERVPDVVPLALMFLEHYSAENNCQIPTFTPEALTSLTGHPWPGNVRQLQNEMMRISALNHKEVISPADFSPEFKSTTEAPNATPRSYGAHERELLKNTLIQCNGNKLEAARILGLGRQTVYNMITRHGLEGWVKRKRFPKPAEPPKLEQQQTQTPAQGSTGVGDFDVTML